MGADLNLAIPFVLLCMGSTLWSASRVCSISATSRSTPSVRLCAPRVRRTSICICRSGSSCHRRAVACLFGAAGRPDLEARGDYLAIVALGFGEIIRSSSTIFATGEPTNGPQGRRWIDPFRIGSFNLKRRPVGLDFTGPSSTTTSGRRGRRDHRSQPAPAEFPDRSRVGRSARDEIAARAMGINTRNMKLLAFAMGASSGSGVSEASCRDPEFHQSSRSCWSSRS